MSGQISEDWARWKLNSGGKQPKSIIKTHLQIPFSVDIGIQACEMLKPKHWMFTPATPESIFEDNLFGKANLFRQHRDTFLSQTLEKQPQ